MRNILLEIEYDGTNYSGWQIQKSHKLTTIQETIEKILRQVLQEKIRLIGSGRTDAGVHAKAQVANFKTNSTLSLVKIRQALNSLLPKDIAIKSIRHVPLGFHSRFYVKYKIYRYTILNRDYSSAFLNRYVWHYPYKLNMSLMKNEARSLVGKHNFKSFQASNSSIQNCVRRIKRLTIKKEKDFIYFDIEADGFLYKMARNIVGTLVQIGRGKAIDIIKLLNSLDRKAAGPTAPACGLTLLKVKYERRF